MYVNKIWISCSSTLPAEKQLINKQRQTNIENEFKKRENLDMQINAQK